MRIPLFAFTLLDLGLRMIAAQTTPLDAAIPEGMETPITCELTTPPPLASIPVFGTEQECQDAIGAYHYLLWLPRNYAAHPTKKWPCIFVMSPIGDAGMGAMYDYVTENGFVVVLLCEARNGPWPPIVGNFLAAHDDVVKRVRIADGQKYATGFSGGTRGCSVFVQARPGFCGYVMQAAGPAFDAHGEYHVTGIKENPKLYSVLIMGTTDSHREEVEKVKRSLPKERLEVLEFKGEGGAPPYLFAKAMDWIKSRADADSGQ